MFLQLIRLEIATMNDKKRGMLVVQILGLILKYVSSWQTIFAQKCLAE